MIESVMRNHKSRDKNIMQIRSFLLSVAVAILMVTSIHAAEPVKSNKSMIIPFKISIPEEELIDLNYRLKHTRFPGKAPLTNWEYGVPVDYMKSMVDYWMKDYDWRKTEALLNSYNQYLTEIDGLNIHFMHIKSKHPDAKPLLLIHGWPGSFVEFLEVIEPLIDPENHGGSAEDAFHLVIPSLPGFGFSEAPTEQGWSYLRMGPVMAQLMAKLGYERYGVQGGDWGAGVSIWLGINNSEHLMGVHLNHPGFISGIQPKENPWKGVSPEERERQENRKSELLQHWGYGKIQSTRPQALAYGLNDSPTGLAAWIIDKFYAWSDHNGDLDNAFSRDEILNNIMVYWLTKSLPSSIRVYFEKKSPGLDTDNMSVPIGAALFPKEITLPPRRWFERTYGDHVKRYTIMPEGGHFAAMEEPDLLVPEIRAFFRDLD